MIIARISRLSDAVDMDIYGAFQLCALGILAAPLTARISRTYFNNPGRNLIFLWFGLILGGLLSLTVEFLRTKTHECSHTDSGIPLTHISDWHYGDTCGLICSEDEGPFSPMRQDAANNIYVIPAPTVFSLGTATLLSAACCIPPILSMASMWNKILEINWRARFGHDTAEDPDSLIEGTNATPTTVKGINSRIRRFLEVVEAPVFGAAVREFMSSCMLHIVLILNADTRCPDHWRTQLLQRPSGLPDRTNSQCWYVFFYLDPG